MADRYSLDQMQDAVRIALAVSDAIRQLGTVPAGHLYVQVQHKLNMEAFQSLLTFLEDAELITYSRDHVITWIGPSKNGDLRDDRI